jgi:prepilin-type N-terminal cleavage/methylation domain-containing protein
MTAAQQVRVRRGFTLLELMLALTLTAIAASVAGASIVAARRTGERVDAHKADGEAEARLRAVLTDMLRHPPAADRTSEPLLQLQRNETGSILTFLTTGVQLPLGTGPVWRATLMIDSNGLRLDAAPVAGGARGIPITMQLPGVRTLDVDVLEVARAGDLAQWRSDWPLAQTRPAAIALRWQRATETATPLVTVLDPLGAGQVVP